MRSLKDNLLIQFSVVSFVVIASTAVALTLILSNKIRSDAIDTLVEEAVGASSGRLLRVVTPEDLEVPMTGQQYEKFHEFVRESIVSDRTARIKLWAKDGTVVYSNDPAGVGDKFPTNKNLLKALRGEKAIEIKLPTASENIHERHLGTLMEIYTPIVFPGAMEPHGVLEIYQYYLPTAERIQDLRRWLIGSIGIGFLILYGGLVSIVWKGWRTINSQREGLQQAQDQLVQSAKLAAVGDLLAGVTHELNNPIGSVIGYTELLMQRPADEHSQEWLQRIHEQAKRAASVVSDLLTFSRQQELELAPLSLNDVVTKSLELFDYQLRKSPIEIRRELSEGLPPAVGDARRLQQVFLNIISNAEQAMAEAHGKGVLTVVTRLAGDKVQAVFIDDGPGIARNHLDRLSQPFFTTKPVGEGTGLGLSVSYGIVRDHGGEIWAESTLGRGATFVVELPASA